MKKIVFITVIGLVMCVSSPSFAQIDDINKYVWDLAPSYYSTDEDWEKERKYIVGKLSVLKSLKGKLNKSAKTLADGLDQIRDVRWRAQKMSVYGFLVTSVDTKSERAQYQNQVGTLVETEVEAALSFVENELHQIGKAKLVQWIKTEPRLDLHKRYINRIILTSDHAMAGEGQSILSKVAGRWPSLAGDVYQSLIESDLGWPTVNDEDGNPQVLDPAAFSGMRTSQDSSAVNRANRAFYAKLKMLENSFGLLLTRRIEADVTIARYRKFGNAIDASFFMNDGAPIGTYKNIIQTTRDNAHLLQKYFQLRTKSLGLPTNNFSNINIPYSDFSKTFSISDAKRMTTEVAGRLGKSYQSDMQSLFERPVFHLPPLPDKRATYGIYQPVGRGNTYMIMNYRNRFSNARAFCGGLFLMQAYESVAKDRLSDTRNDPPIYSNAIIYLGNILFEDYAIESATNSNEKRAYLIFALDRLWSLFFQWSLMAELEDGIQQRIINREPPTGRQISSMYLEILRQVFGHTKGVVNVDENLALDWMNTANLFYNYDHLFWAPAISTSCLLAERIKMGDADAINATHKILASCEVDFSYQLLKSAKVDLNSDEPYFALIRRMNNLLNQLEETMDK